MPDWNAFTRFLDEAAAKDFALGHWDCLIFADGAQTALHGLGFAGEWLGGYVTTAGRPRPAGRLSKTFGHDTIEAALDSRLRRIAAHPPRGAVALMPAADYPGFSLGVVTGARAAFLRFPRGLQLVPVAACAGFWNR